MWSAQAPVFSPEQQIIHDTAVALRQELTDLRSKRSALEEQGNTAYYEAEQAANTRYLAKHAGESDTLAQATDNAYQEYLRLQQLYQLASNAYTTAKQNQKLQERKQATYTIRAASTARTKYLRIIQADIDALYAQESPLRERVHMAERAAAVLKYVPGIQPVGPENNNGEAVVTPDGTVYMVPMYEDHGNVKQAVESNHRMPGHWVRITSGGGLSDVDGRFRLSRDQVTDAQLNSLSDFADMLASNADYTTAAERIRAWVNTMPESESDW